MKISNRRIILDENEDYFSTDFMMENIVIDMSIQFVKRGHLDHNLEYYKNSPDRTTYRIIKRFICAVKRLDISIEKRERMSFGADSREEYRYNHALNVIWEYRGLLWT